MKRRNLWKKASFLLAGAAGILSCSMHICAAEAEVNYEDIYNKAAEQVLTTVTKMGGEPTWLQYVLYDMNDDGYLEFLIESGTCNADMTYQVYTTDGTYCIYLGAVPGPVVVWEYEEGSGFYTQWVKQEYEKICLYTIKDGQLEEEVLFEGENPGYRMSHEELKTQINARSVGDGVVWIESETEAAQ